MSDLPKPLLALIGVAAEARNLPAHAVTAGVTVIGLTYKARQDYARFVERGERALAEVFGNSETPEQHVPVPPVVRPAPETVSPDRPRTLPEPLPGYDGLSLGALRGRLRGMSEDELVRALDYERAHQARQPVVTLLENRLARLGVE